MYDFPAMIEAQRAFFHTGRTQEISFREAALERLENWIRAHDEDLLAALQADLAKAPFEGYATEVGVILDELKFARHHLRSWRRPRRARSTLKNFPSTIRLMPEPYGVALIMSPWNYPLMLTVTPLIAAVAAGNCALVKPSAYSPASSAIIARMCAEVFEPAHVTVVEGGRRENETLLSQKYDIIFFTGSKAVGRTVLEAAAGNLTPVILELGGKSPCVVDETANLKLAARRIAWGKFLNAGQTCVAPDYVLAHESVKEPLIRELRSAIRTMYGETPCENPDYPKIINEKHFTRLNGLMAGEHIAYGGKSNPDTRKMEPTLLDSAGWDAPVMGEEIFGPLLPILTYRTQEEAVNEITARPKPLAFYLFTADKSAERFFLQNVSFGGGCVNDTVTHLASPQIPFGGVGESGMGAYHGKAGFDTFTHYKGVLHKSRHVDIPLRYPPYTKSALKWLKRL